MNIPLCRRSSSWRAVGILCTVLAQTVRKAGSLRVVDITKLELLLVEEMSKKEVK